MKNVLEIIYTHKICSEYVGNYLHKQEYKVDSLTEWLRGRVD